MNSNIEKEICMSCFFSSCWTTALVYGWDPFRICSCKRPIYKHTHPKLTKIYIRCLQFTLWQFTVLLMWQSLPSVGEYALCLGFYDVFENDGKIMNIFLVLLYLAYSITLTFCSHNKIDLITKLRNEWFYERMIVQNNALVRNVSLSVSFIVILFTIIFQIVNLNVYYPAFEKKQYFHFEALMCTVEFGFVTTIIIGGVAHALLLIGMVICVSYTEFEELCSEFCIIRSSDRNLRRKLQDLMNRHQDLWTFINQWNTKFSIVSGVFYFGIIWGTSFLYYAYFYIHMHEFLRIWIFMLMITLSFICIICCCFLCCIAFTMQSGFQDIRRFVNCDLNLRQKLKVLNFIKRFGKVSLCLLIGGFYNVNKRIPLKISPTKLRRRSLSVEIVEKNSAGSQNLKFIGGFTREKSHSVASYVIKDSFTLPIYKGI
ncbi:uncharacterized protein LOC111637978 [Centruroides sculpturatus]|uniref:uncharacterized protein LOC111637978 n=1 Tax=Centruroides sculpturatus TaxID=218467 RepID=UPI000C6C99C0|nr:uncharacterized protein LOC111637978 [Centruroides sculpturatus]